VGCSRAKGHGVARYPTRDHLGSIREVTDGAGTVVTRNDYDPYGRLTRVAGSEDSRFGYTDHLNHVPSRLSLAVYRAHDAQLGRWISSDPIGLAGGLNLHQYAASNPLYYVDRDGLNPFVGVWPGVGIGGAIGGLPGAVVGGIIGGIIGGIVGSAIWNAIRQQDESKPDIPYPGPDPAAKPGRDYEWKGKPGSKPGDKDGNWYNPKTGQSLRPDTDHKPPVGPHWDYKDPDGDWWRMFPNGDMCRK